MSVTIDIKPELEERLHREAVRSGLDERTYIVNALEERLRSVPLDVTHISPVEADLLQRINEGLSEQTWQRYSDLVAIRRRFELAPEEQGELATLTEQIEQTNARRMGYLAELARLRGRSLRDIMRDLGIEAPASI